MMEPISNLAIIVVPRFVKVVVLLILGMLALLYFALSLWGIYDTSKPGWIEAGTDILGILLPFIIIGLLIGFSQSGVDALLRRNAEFLSYSIPRLTNLLGDPPGGFRPASERHSAEAPLPEVLVQCARNSSIANYIVTIDRDFALRLDGFAQPRRIAFRVELNAMKANVNVCVAPGSGRKVNPRNLFPHSIAGAEQEGYWFAPDLIVREVDGVACRALVGVKKLDADFLTNPVKRLEFGQDLMLMLRSMLHERPVCFALASP